MKNKRRQEMKKLCTYLWIIILMASPAFAGLVAQWDFSDGTYNDQVGSNHGEAKGTISIVGSGNVHFSKAIQTGSALDDTLNVGNLSTGLGLSTNSFTLSYWVKRAAFPTDSANFKRVFESHSGDFGIQTTLRASDVANANKLYSGMQAAAGDKLLNGSTVADDAWHWIVIRYDGDADAANYFEDGHLYDTEAGILSLAGDRNTYIGNGLGGLIGDIRIYDAPLTYVLDVNDNIIGGELDAIYEVPGGLVAHWDFNDGTYNDQVGFNNGEAMGTISIVPSGNPFFAQAMETGSALDDVLNVGYLTSLNLSTNSFTLSYWIERDSFLEAENGINFRRVFESNNSATSGGIQTVVRASDASNPNKLYSTLQGYGGTADKLLNGGTMADGDWHWVVILYDASADSAAYFEDGHYYETEYGVFSLADGSRKVYIGNGMGGRVGDIRIYNTALSYVLDGNNDVTDGELYAIYGEPKPANIVSFSMVSNNVMKMVFYTYAFSTNNYYPLATADLVVPSWTNVPHSKDGSAPFILTNLTYSTAEGTNDVIYVQADDAQGFFGIGE